MYKKEDGTKPEISVILPVYNGEKYILNSLNSIAKQTYRNFEVIIIDNASTDRTSLVCKEWIEQCYINSTYIYTEKKGVSNARNIGLEKAEGNYIIFVDADDYVSNLYLEILYTNIVDFKSDISICGYLAGKNKECSFEKICKYESIPRTLTFDEIFEHIFYDNDIGGFVWNKLFKKSFLNGLKFDTDIEMCEDMLFFFRILKKKPKVIYQKINLYYYYVNEESVSQSIDRAFNMNKELNYAISMEKLKKEICFKVKFIQEINASVFLYAAANKLKYAFVKNKDREIIKNLNVIFKQYWKDFLLSKEYLKKTKIKVLISILLWRVKPIIKKG